MDDLHEKLIFNKGKQMKLTLDSSWEFVGIGANTGCECAQILNKDGALVLVRLENIEDVELATAESIIPQGSVSEQGEKRDGKEFDGICSLHGY